MLEMFGLVSGLLLLMFSTLRGLNLFIAAPACALLVALSGGVDIFTLNDLDNDSFVKGYMNGFSGFIGDWFFMFLLGSYFGKMMENTGAAESLANWLAVRLGRKHAALSVVAACALLTYGGVSIFVVAFSVYPMALSLFKEANIPHRFVPAALAFGSVTFTMTSAGSPEIQNWIPTKYLDTTPFAAWEVSLVVAVAMACAGFVWLEHMIRKAKANGEGFEFSEIQLANIPKITENDLAGLPHPITGVIPLVVVLLTSLSLHTAIEQNALIVALLAGCITQGLINLKYIKSLGQVISKGTNDALLAIGNTAAVVGFGTVAKLSPAFEVVVASVINMEGNELLGAAIAISTIAGLTGSASGGQSIALPELAPHYLEAGVDAEHLHRITAISSGALDSLPHNGYVVTTIRVICNETHKTAYWPLAALTIVIPTFGVLLAVALIGVGL